MTKYILATAAGAFLFCFQPAFSLGQNKIELARSPALSPDGSKLAFAWNGDVWMVNSAGGAARQMTTSVADDGEPAFSPDGKQLAFTSDRTGSNQLYVKPRSGGPPRQLTFHTEGSSLEEWYPDGTALLVSGNRDHYWRHSERFFRIELEKRNAPKLLFDTYGSEGTVSPDGSKLLFSREGERWWRKGYVGSRASQVWLYDLETQEFTQVVAHPTGCRSPMWKADGKGFYYVGAQSGAFNLWEHDLESGEETQLTEYPDDSVVMPCISRDGTTIVFRHLFTLYRYRPGEDEEPQAIEITSAGDTPRPAVVRRNIEQADHVAFSKDGLEVGFVAGGDLWVMDTVLREPKQVTDTPGAERDPVFTEDGSAILYITDDNEQSDIHQAVRADDDKYWWQNDSFEFRRLTEDAEVERDLTVSPTGKKVAFVRGRGDLWTMDLDGKNAKRLVRSWNQPEYDWSPDGKWIVYAKSDSNFNRDIHVVPLDGSREPFNITKHPDNEYDPVWSPDGKAIAFVGRRFANEYDIYFVYLQKHEDEIDSRGRKLLEALEKMEKQREEPKPEDDPKPEGGEEKEKEDSKEDEATEEEANQDESKEEEEDSEDDLPEVKIDFDDIHERIRQVEIPGVEESELFWSHDSKRLAFQAKINDKSGTYTIEPPEELTPKLLSEKTGSSARWIAEGNRILWLSDGVPASLTADGKFEAYKFTAPQAIDVNKKFAAAFDSAWRSMRDGYYDEELNHRNWDEVRRKYQAAAEHAVDMHALAEVVSLMLGELNGSHLGFYPTTDLLLHAPSKSDWRDVTAHLGLRFDPEHNGPGLLVRDVIREGPSDREESHIFAGETVLSIDGTTVDPGMDLSEVLNGYLERDIELRISDADGNERTVVLRPITYGAARELLYEEHIRHNRAQVEKQSDGKLGYLHIRGMNFPSFHRFERELYAAGAGRDGLVIDVRENGGGFTTDHLLTSLTQPEHAITVPRGGEPGYPHDRMVYATWNRPIIVLCNQNSFSNAEIFSHAIKTLKRGQLVGVTTAGGVISTGATSVLDIGLLRMPFRGWFVLETGQDMELNGAVPHHILWPQPGEIPAGIDRQLDKAIEVLGQEVEAWLEEPRPELHKASSRLKQPGAAE
ncbi:Tricorn protease homolog 1 [Durusdinium trenchii]|uniref:Tricorn protease homolog 1 n=1 Tax=Durusdinium trenchii TaxID=1381693 RepID=A0ABP0NSX6_9DINO